MRLYALAVTIGLLTSGGTGLAADEEVDVELVLAVDVSGSMDLEEAQVQRAGYVDALNHPDFIDAVRNGLTGRIAITYFEWAGRINESSFLGWHTISNAEEAKSFAAVLEAARSQPGAAPRSRSPCPTAQPSSRQTAMPACEGSSTYPATAQTIPARPSRRHAMPRRRSASSSTASPS